ncbi:MAG: methyltransferase [Bacteroidota bacterium]
MILLGWVLYFLLHSLLALNSVKQLAQQSFPAFFPFYRLTYNVIAIAGYALILWYQFDQPQDWLWRPGWLVRLPGLGLGLAGAWIMREAMRGYDLGEFVGQKQLAAPDFLPPLQTRGWNARVRHPLYFGSILGLGGAFLLWPSQQMLIFLLTHLAYIYLGSLWEEKKLETLYGPAYVRYKKRVPGLIPWRKAIPEATPEE